MGYRTIAFGFRSAQSGQLRRHMVMTASPGTVILQPRASHRHHDLGLARAAKRLAEAMARRLQDDYGGSYNWEGNDGTCRYTP